MEKQVFHMLLEGSNFEIGKTFGRICRSVPGFAEAVTIKKAFLSKQDETRMYQLFDEFCPGINEELSGFADELGISPVQALYYAMTYLRPGCSQMAVLPSKTENRHTMLARNFEFGDAAEDYTFATTKIQGRYAHMGSTVMQFGRSEGMNEHGLAVSQSSAGIPVGNFEFAAKPAITGLQFWAVIRSVLENCKDVDEAVEWTKQMPIAYNINLLLADKSGNAALLETWIGEGYCREAVVNLKLPMKQRYAEVKRLLERIEDGFKARGIRVEIGCKQLYHDREEVTCHLRRLVDVKKTKAR